MTSTSDEISAKRMKIETKAMSDKLELAPLSRCPLICVSSVPTFGVITEVVFQINLQWIQEEGEVGRLITRSRTCGVVNLTSRDVIMGKYHVNMNGRHRTEEGEKNRAGKM